MILSIDVLGYIKLKEVNSEEEAFFEMRRYMQVNNIYSDTTTVYRNIFADRHGITESIKLVEMCPIDGNNEELVFAIHYDTKPRYSSVDDAVLQNSHFAYCFEEYKSSELSHKYNSLKFCRYKSENINDYFESWFPDEYNRYISDLEKERR